METPKLGHHVEICIDVNDIHETLAYYKKLGFEVYTGGPDKGWCTITDGIMYLALFKDNFIEKEFGVKVLFNYRGGNMNKIIPFLKNQQLNIEKADEKEDGIGDAIIKDPNDFKIYFDTHPVDEKVK